MILPSLRNWFLRSLPLAEPPLRPAEQLLLEHMRREPSKWFLDYSARPNGLLRAANREKGVIVTVQGIQSDPAGRLRGDEHQWPAFYGSAPTTDRFTVAFTGWAVAEHNVRLEAENRRRIEGMETFIAEAFKK